ncbi:MAG: single-stranded-DNA-specific exonuclease RecJ [Alphaproteobacteria bacterium]|nr:single-stranded-DNA-specific exonuclease RecJ [Alphaproteobacteria bacterium]
MSASAFLGVEKSLCGRAWRARACDDRVALALAERFSLPEIVGRVLAGRGVGIAEAEAFLDPTLRRLLPDPSHLKDMDQAVERLVRAIQRDEAVAVFGDYDVDGATSSALIRRFFAAVGARLAVYIPDRLKEGYGPNAPALKRLKEQGIAVVVTVDCGITAHGPLAQARACGLDVVVIDHHVGEPALPPAVAVVDPNRLDEVSPHRQLAAVGVAFLLIVGLNRALRRAGWYSDARPEPELMQWLDLVALGTVADVVPLTGVNRALVRQGLAVMARRANTGLAALADVAGLKQAPEAYHLGFVLGPRVNAGGRVGEAELGARLLGSDDPGEAAAIARHLDQLNRERQAIERQVLEDAIARIDADGGPGAVAHASGDGWHPGVIGIVASRMKERYGRPAMVTAIGADGIGKGSGRSVGGADMGSAVVAARQAGLLINGGGHAMAAGWTVARDRVPDFVAFVAERLGGRDGGPPMAVTEIDATLQPLGATPALASALARLEPYGAGNPRPVFALPDLRVTWSNVVGGGDGNAGHVRCALAGTGGGRLNAIAFRAAGTALGQALMAPNGPPLHLAGCVKLDTWNGEERVQLVIEDGARV